MEPQKICARAANTDPKNRTTENETVHYRIKLALLFTVQQ